MNRFALLAAAILLSPAAMAAETVQSGGLTWYVVPWHMTREGVYVLPKDLPPDHSVSQADAKSAAERYIAERQRSCVIDDMKQAGKPGGWVVQFDCKTEVEGKPSP